MPEEYKKGQEVYWAEVSEDGEYSNIYVGVITGCCFNSDRNFYYISNPYGVDYVEEKYMSHSLDGADYKAKVYMNERLKARGKDAVWLITEEEHKKYKNLM